MKVTMPVPIARPPVAGASNTDSNGSCGRAVRILLNGRVADLRYLSRPAYSDTARVWTP